MGERTVLLIDDEPAVSEVLAAMLRRADFEVLKARSGQEAVAWMERRGPDVGLIVCDVLLGDESGAALAGHLRELQPTAKLLFVSGFPLNMLFENGLLASEALGNGSTLHLQKPFMPAELIATISRLLATNANQGSLASDPARNFYHACAAH